MSTGTDGTFGDLGFGAGVMGGDVEQTDAAELERALEFRRTQARRAQVDAERARMLSGSRIARDRLSKAWAALSHDPGRKS